MKKWSVVLVLSSFFVTHLANAHETRFVLGVGGGAFVPMTQGADEYFPIKQAVTDEFYRYQSQEDSSTMGLYEIFVGFEHPTIYHFLIQAGVAYDGMESYTAAGPFTQGGDEQSANTYDYKFKVEASQVLAQAKFMRPYKNFYPYVLVGLGVGINTASDYSTNVPPFMTFTREYKNNTSTSFAFRVGTGFDIQVLDALRVGVAYRFAGLGDVELGSATIDGEPVSGSLSQSDAYVNELLFQLTYLH